MPDIDVLSAIKKIKTVWDCVKTKSNLILFFIFSGIFSNKINLVLEKTFPHRFTCIFLPNETLSNEWVF